MEIKVAEIDTLRQKGEKMPKRLNLINNTFGRLTVVEDCGNNHRRESVWLCKCICGRFKRTTGNKLKGGIVQSCGCLIKEANLKKITKHGKAGSQLYIVWSGMKQRCVNPKHIHYNIYGGRGITVCKEWSEDFGVFEAWAINSGWKPGLEIDRIDNEKGYFPENCRIVTHAENVRNKRNSVRGDDGEN